MSGHSWDSEDGQSRRTQEPFSDSQATGVTERNTVAHERQSFDASMVTCSGDLVTVRPKGANIRDVLQALAAKAGITVHLPPGGLDARVFDEQIGPMPARDALLQLLYGSGFNYIIQNGSGDRPAIIWLEEGKESEPLKSAAVPTVKQPASVIIAEQAPYEDFQEEPAQEQPVIPRAPSNASTGPSPNVPGVPENFNLQEAAAQAHKTPAEILDELQKRQLEILRSQAPP